MPEEKENEYESPYCPVCSSCGEEGCCSPIFCKQSPDGHYCEGSLRDLKFGYQMYKDIYKLIPKDKETQKEFDRIWEENYEIFYKQEEEK